MPSPFLGFIKILVAIATLHLQKNQWALADQHQLKKDGLRS